MNSFGEQLQAQFVAEYVEDAEIQAYMKDLGVEFSQGYYFVSLLLLMKL